ncbi:hypothetical protein HDU92_001173 [Lobulomyces angularis]|nr:hypothetical protein HDU92_001173 [Lobulomyces angularis]
MDSDNERVSSHEAIANVIASVQDIHGYNTSSQPSNNLHHQSKSQQLQLPNNSQQLDTAASGLLSLSQHHKDNHTSNNLNGSSLQHQSNDQNVAADANAAAFALYYPQAQAALEIMARTNFSNIQGYPFSPQLLHEAALAAAQASQQVQEHLQGQSQQKQKVHQVSPAPNNDINFENAITTVVDGKERYLCPTCNRAFSRMYNLKSHIRTHQNHKPFVCETCNLRFTRNHDLNRHSKIHSREKPHVCADCGRHFARRDALKRHERIDPEGKKLHCNPLATAAALSQGNQAQELSQYSDAVLGQAVQQIQQQMQAQLEAAAAQKLNLIVQADDLNCESNNQ